MKIHSEHWNDADGNPAGGSTFGNGFAISWQNGPLGRCTCNEVAGQTPFYSASGSGHLDGCDRKHPNGAFVEDVIAAAADRIKFYQHSRFRCGENEMALGHLYAALQVLQQRTARREAANTEGTHQGN